MTNEVQAILADGFLKVSEAARLLGCSKSQIYSLIDRGELQAIRVGSLHRILRGSFEKLIASQLECST